MSRYIDADLLKQSIPNTKMDEFENCRYCRLLDEEQVKDLIDQQQTADVRENITAHKVIGGGEHDGATCWFECSNCRTMVDINDKYCSECGARFEA